MSGIWSLSLMMMFVMMCTMHFYPQTEATPIQKPRVRHFYPSFNGDKNHSPTISFLSSLQTRSQTFYPNGRYGRADPDLSSDINENALGKNTFCLLINSKWNTRFWVHKQTYPLNSLKHDLFLSPQTEEERSRVMVASSGQPARSGSQALNCWYTGVGAFFQCYRSFSSSTPPLPRSISISSGLDNILNKI